MRWLPWITDMPYTSLAFLQYFLLPPYLSTGRPPVANGGGRDESADEVVEGVFPFVYLATAPNKRIDPVVFAGSGYTSLYTWQINDQNSSPVKLSGCLSSRLFVRTCIQCTC